MQMFEYGLLGVVLIGCAEKLFGARISRPWARPAYLAASVVVLAAQLAVEGPHWQVWPLYFAVALSVLLQFVPVRRYRLTGILTACGVAGLALISAALCWALPVFSLPLPTGIYGVGTHSEIVEDSTRAADGSVRAMPPSGDPRQLPIRVWYPAMRQTGHSRAKYSNADELKPMLRYRALVRTNSLSDADPVPLKQFPILVFHPKWNGSRVQDTFLAEDLASHGYVVVAIDHPGNAALADTGHGVVTCKDPYAVSVPPASSSAAVRTAWADELKVWVADDEAVLKAFIDRTSSAGKPLGFPYPIDPSRIGSFGHSFGGSAAIALLGVDPRVMSAVNLDGWIFDGLNDRTTQPILLFYEAAAETSQTPVGAEGELDAADRASVTDSLNRFGGLVAYVADSQHLDFTDQTLVSPLQRLTFTGPIRGERMREITRGLLVGFFDQTLKANGELPEYREVKIHRYPGPTAY